MRVSNPQSAIANPQWVWGGAVRLAPEGWPFILPGWALVVLGAWVARGSPWVWVPEGALFLIAIWLLVFFRDPVRAEVPQASSSRRIVGLTGLSSAERGHGCPVQHFAAAIRWHIERLYNFWFPLAGQSLAWPGHPPLPPNRACGFPAHGSPVVGFLIGSVSRDNGLWLR